MTAPRLTTTIQGLTGSYSFKDDDGGSDGGESEVDEDQGVHSDVDEGAEEGEEEEVRQQQYECTNALLLLVDL